MDDTIKYIIDTLILNNRLCFYFDDLFTVETGFSAPKVKVNDCRSHSVVSEQLVGLTVICGMLFFIFRIYGRIEVIGLGQSGSTSPYAIHREFKVLKFIAKLLRKTVEYRGNLP